MLQRWQKLTFLHWRYTPELIEPFIPKPLILDTFDGAAWLGLVPFLIRDLRPPWLSPLPWISQFPETNVRTYVRGPDGKRGVWFFTLEADRLLAVWTARTIYHLPYRWAAMNVSQDGGYVCYRSERKRLFGRGATDVVIEPGEGIDTGALENFLTARFRLFSTSGRTIFTAPIEHDPWPLQSAKVVRLQESLFNNLGLPEPLGLPVAQYAADLSVRIGQLSKVI
jgi:hypothetical protein